MRNKFGFIIALLAMLVCLTSTISAQSVYKTRNKKPDNSGGLLSIHSAANRAAAESAALADSDASSDNGVVDVERLDSSEAAARGQATESTLSTVKTDLDLFTQEIADATNSTTSTLTANSTFPGGYVTAAGYVDISVSVRTDQNSATNGLVISWSDDGSHALITQAFTITANTGFIEELPRRALYYKVALTNSSVNQTSLTVITRKLPRLSTIGTALAPFRVDPTGATTQPVSISGTPSVSLSGTPAVNIAGTTHTIQRVSINTATSNDNTIISAPGAGHHIHLVTIRVQNTDASASTVVYKDNTTAINGAGFVLDANAFDSFVAAGGAGNGEIILSDNAPFVIYLAGNQQLSGYAVYWID